MEARRAVLAEILLDYMSYALKALSERRLRAALTIIGIAIGPTALVAISSVVQGYSDYIINKLQGLGQNLVVVFPTSNYRITESDLNYFRSLEGVYRAEPFYAVTGYVRQGADEIKVQVYCVDITILMDALKGLKIMAGSLPSSSEVSHAIIGFYIAYDEKGERHYWLGDIVSIKIPEIESGARLRYKRVNVIVDAVLAEFGNAFVVNPDTTVFLPLDAGPRLLGLHDWSGVLIVTEDPAYVEPITKHLRKVYADRLTVVSLVEISRVVASITAAMNFVTFATGLAAFAVAAAGVAATMITSIMERTREIGVLKAIGFTNTDIVMMVLLEALIMSLIGAALGIALGAIGAYILASKGMIIRGAHVFVIKAAPAITPQLVGRALALTITVGVLGSIIPAYQAARIPPAVALRYE